MVAELSVSQSAEGYVGRIHPRRRSPQNCDCRASTSSSTVSASAASISSSAGDITPSTKDALKADSCAAPTAQTEV